MLADTVIKVKERDMWAVECYWSKDERRLLGNSMGAWACYDDKESGPIHH
jgi:hypothetical protein